MQSAGKPAFVQNYLDNLAVFPLTEGFFALGWGCAMIGMANGGISEQQPLQQRNAMINPSDLLSTEEADGYEIPRPKTVV